jgi:hypothetical protein
VPRVIPKPTGEEPVVECITKHLVPIGDGCTRPATPAQSSNRARRVALLPPPSPARQTRGGERRWPVKVRPIPPVRSSTR